MIEHSEPSRPIPMLLQAGLVLAILLVFARVTMVQVLRDPDPVVPNARAAPLAAGPTATLVLDCLMCLPALLVLVQRTIDREFRLRWNMSAMLFLGLAGFAVFSSFWASDHFAAAITSAHWLAAAVLLWSFSQLVRTWGQVRIVGAACLAVLLVLIAQGIIYYFVDLPDLAREWNRTRLEQLARRGWDPESFEAKQFEQRVLAGELLGFNTSPNTLGALVVMLAIVSVGIVIQRIRDRDEAGWPMALIAGIAPFAWVLYHTGSRSAAGAAILGGLILATTPWLKKRKVIYIGAVAAFLIGTAALIGHGMYHGTLLHDSLTFRWRYWVGAMRILVDHPLLGVGWSNFGDYYLGVRLPMASEEVKDPHNLIVRVLAELGLIGGALMIAWLARLGWEISSPVSLSDANHASHGSLRRTAGTILWICGGAMLVNVLASVDMSSDTAFVLTELLRRAQFLFLGGLGMGVALLKSSKEPLLDERPAIWVLRAMSAALGAFFICNLVDFSFFEPGPMCVAAMLIGSVIGARQLPGRVGQSSRSGPIFCLTGFGVLGVAAIVGVVVPVGLAEQKAHRGDALLRGDRPAPAAQTLEEAYAMLWIPNADYAHRAAIASIYAQAPVERVRQLFEQAITAQPVSPTSALALARFEMRLAQPDSKRAISCYERVVTLDPCNIAARLELAAALARFGEPARAVAQYREVIRYNSLLDAMEPKRLVSQQLIEIDQAIKTLGG